MTKKNDKRLCWNCDGSVSMHLVNCPYCGVDLNATQSAASQNFSSPFQSQDKIPPPPYGSVPSTQEYAMSESEWKQGMNQEEEEKEEESSDLIALFLLLPGVVLFLFGVVLFFFSKDGALVLRWKESFAYLYLVGAIPLLLLGWRALR